MATPAWRTWSETLRRRISSALVLVILLAGAGAAVDAAPDPMVEAIQRALVERGFDPGKIDGAMGWRTRGAIRVFQRSFGLPDTGRADTATLEALGLAPPGREDARVEAQTPQTGTLGTETEPGPSRESPVTETPDGEPTTESGVDAVESESRPAVPAPIPSLHAPASETPDTEPATVPGAGAPDSESSAAEPAPLPMADAPGDETPDTAPDTEPDTAAPETEPDRTAPEAETPRAEPAPVPDRVVPNADKPSARPATKPLTEDIPRPAADPAQPTPKPATTQKPTPTPEPTAKPKSTATPKPAATPTRCEAETRCESETRCEVETRRDAEVGCKAEAELFGTRLAPPSDRRGGTRATHRDRRTP